MVISREEGMKLLRSNLEAELEQISKTDANDEVKERTEEIKRLLALSDDELAKEFHSKRKKDEKKELSADDLDEVAGGLVINAARTPFDFVIVDDVTGEVLDSNCYCYDESLFEICEHAGVSTQKISVDEYNRRFGKNYKLGMGDGNGNDIDYWRNGKGKGQSHIY